jgi:TonB-linked SusC/RagA family outer membrane protein
MLFKAHGNPMPPRQSLLHQTFRVMRIMAVFLFILGMHVSATGLSQKITLSLKNAPLARVFDEISKQAGVSVVYKEALLAHAQPVTIEVHEATIRQVLEKCLESQPFTYRIEGGMIVIQPLLTTVLQPVDSLPRNAESKIDFKGQVLNEKQEPLQGASVEIKGKKKGTYSDRNGIFELEQVEEDATLIISFSGYLLKEIRLKGRTFVTIALTQNSSPLDQVQVIAYGTTTQRLNTGNVTTVAGKEIQRQPVSNPLAALEGQVAGLVITQNTGIPGGSFKVQIRGQNSIFNGNDPLYIVDGAPLSSELLPNLNYAALGSGAVGGNPLNFINVSDIESIDILKDADATAIYGSRGANGVVLITTKKGKAGNTAIDINAYTGVAQIDRSVKWLNTQQYLALRHEAFNNDGTTPSLANGDFDLLSYDTTRYTNWEKTLIGGTAHYDDVEASASGGNANTQFLIGGGYHRETTVFPDQFSDVKGSLHFNIANTSANKRFKISLTGNFTADVDNLPSADFTFNTPYIAPDAPATYNKDGSINWANSTWGFYGNPYAQLLQTYKGRTTNLIANSSISYQLTKSLELKTTLGYTNMRVNETVLIPTSSYDPSFGITSGNSDFVNNGINSWIIEPQVNYVVGLGSGKITALVGGSIQQSQSEGTTLFASGFSNDNLLNNIQAASSIISGPYTNSTYKYAAGFARISYNLKDEYLLNLSGRRDGSSRFGPGNQFADFGSVGAGWIFSRETEIENALPYLSFGKLRASYGSSGNDQIGDYQYLALYSPTRFPYLNAAGLQATNLANPNFAWEINKKLETGLELGFLKDRILFSVSWYSNRSSNQLVGYSLPSITGFTSITANLPAIVANTGVEITFNTVNIKSGTFTWTSSFNLTIPKNKLVAFPNLATSSYANSYIIGQPLRITRAYTYAGVNDTTGIYQFSVAQGGLKNSPQYPNDLGSTIKLDPQFYGGFQNEFTYKGIDLVIFFQFVKQMGQIFPFNVLPGAFAYNQPVDVVNHWMKPGDKSSFGKVSQNFGSDAYNGYSYASQSDFGYGDASFIRLKNVSLAYQIPGKWEHTAHPIRIKLSLHAQNLLTFTSYQGRDPENQNLNSLPPLRVITGGFEVTF